MNDMPIDIGSLEIASAPNRGWPVGSRIVIGHGATTLRRISDVKNYCSQRLKEGFDRLPVAAYDAKRHRSLGIEALPLRSEPWSLRVREDLGAAETKSTVAIPLAGDCLAPWLHDGDVLFVEVGRHCCDGDFVTLQVPGENSRDLFAFTTKLAHWYRDRILLVSSEPPAWYSEDKQQRFPAVGVVVGVIHYETPAPRSPELQEFLAEAEAKARHDYGDFWSADNVSYHLGHSVRE